MGDIPLSLGAKTTNSWRARVNLNRVRRCAEALFFLIGSRAASFSESDGSTARELLTPKSPWMQ
jgi:hypothetical protein